MPNARFLVTAAIAEIGFPNKSDIDESACVVYTHDSGICDWPLRSSSNTLVQLTLVGIMASSGIRQEQCVNSSALQQLRKLYPVLEGSLGCRLVFGVL